MLEINIADIVTPPPMDVTLDHIPDLLLGVLEENSGLLGAPLGVMNLAYRMRHWVLQGGQPTDPDVQKRMSEWRNDTQWWDFWGRRLRVKRPKTNDELWKIYIGMWAVLLPHLYRRLVEAWIP